jgi:hypothetical protein
MKKPPRERTRRREAERAARQIVRDRQRLSQLVEGGAADRPITVVSSSVIAGRATSQPCPLCEGTLRLDEDTAEKVDGRSLRLAHMTCVRCGVKRGLWFRIVQRLPG